MPPQQDQTQKTKAEHKEGDQKVEVKDEEDPNRNRARQKCRQCNKRPGFRHVCRECTHWYCPKRVPIKEHDCVHSQNTEASMGTKEEQAQEQLTSTIQLMQQFVFQNGARITIIQVDLGVFVIYEDGKGHTYTKGITGCF